MPPEPQSTRTRSPAVGPDDGSVPVPVPRKRSKPDRGKDPPAARSGGRRSESAAPPKSRRVSSRAVRGGGAESATAADPYSLVLKGEPALPFDGWPVPPGGFEAASAGGPLLPAGALSYGPLPEAVFQPDNRKRVADFADPAAFPWRALCRLVITTGSGGGLLGTGWLISPRVVVTAGHCVYVHPDPDQGEFGPPGFAAQVRVTPAYLDGDEPFGSQTSDDLHTVEVWATQGGQTLAGRQSDYGAIILPTPVEVGFFGYGVYDDPDLAGMTVNVYGYPADKDGGSAAWGDFRKLVGVQPRQLFYNLSTYGGQSGCPVFVKGGDEVTAVGIHNYGGTSSNSATRITAEVFADLEAWKAAGQ